MGNTQFTTVHNWLRPLRFLLFLQFSMCAKRILVNFKSILLHLIIHKRTKHYNYLQMDLHLIKTNLQASKLLKTHMYRHKVIKNVKLIKAWIKLRLFIDLAWMKNNIHFGLIFFFFFSVQNIVQHIVFVKLGLSMKLTHLSPVQYWFIHISDEAYIHGRIGTMPSWLK